MKTITLHNKTFEVFIPETEIAAIIHSMADNINKAKIKDPIFINLRGFLIELTDYFFYFVRLFCYFSS